jgi:flagellar hook-basal body complex protein FliE
MTSPISAISGVTGLDAVSGITGTDGPTAPQGPNDDFTSLLAKGLESVQASQAKADNLATQVADGTLADPAQYTMAATEASLGLQLTLAIRNKAVEAFQEIMRMQA